MPGLIIVSSSINATFPRGLFFRRASSSEIGMTGIRLFSAVLYSVRF